MTAPGEYAVTITIDSPAGKSQWRFDSVPRAGILARDRGDLLRMTLEAHERFIGCVTEDAAESSNTPV